MPKNKKNKKSEIDNYPAYPSKISYLIGTVKNNGEGTSHIDTKILIAYFSYTTEMIDMHIILDQSFISNHLDITNSFYYCLICACDLAFYSAKYFIPGIGPWYCSVYSMYNCFLKGFPADKTLQGVISAPLNYFGFLGH